MGALPTLEERRDRKLGLAIACLQDAFTHLEDAKPMLVADETYFDLADECSKRVALVLGGETGNNGLARLASMLKGLTL